MGTREKTSVDEEGLSRGAGGRKALYKFRLPPSPSRSASSRSPSFSFPFDASTAFTFPLSVSVGEEEVTDVPSLFCPPFEAEAEAEAETESEEVD